MNPAHAQYGQYVMPHSNNLPHTGVNLGLMLAVSLALLAFGGAMVWLERRRG